MIVNEPLEMHHQILIYSDIHSNSIMTSQNTATIRYIPLLLQCLKAHGYRRSQFLESLEIPLDFMKGNTLRLPSSTIEHIWQQARDLTGNQHLGLLCANQLTMTDYGIMAHLWMNCRTLREGFDASRANEKLMHTGMQSNVEILGNDTEKYTNQFRIENTWAEKAFIEFDFLSILRIGQHLVPEDFRKQVIYKEVGFQHQPLASPDIYNEFFNCPVHFGCESNYIHLSSMVMDLPVYANDPMVKSLLEDAVLKLINTTVKLSTSSTIEDYLESSLRQNIHLKLSDIAHKLGISVSTLKRKLQEEGLTYSEVDKRVKLKLSEKLILEGHLSIEQIAEKLHYKDSSSFHRAFKKWTGMTPGKFKAYKP